MQNYPMPKRPSLLYNEKNRQMLHLIVKIIFDFALFSVLYKLPKEYSCMFFSLGQIVLTKIHKICAKI
nr:MAG TPA: hypothetical protein [Caudoviricetes sp.]